MRHEHCRPDRIKNIPSIRIGILSLVLLAAACSAPMGCHRQESIAEREATAFLPVHGSASNLFPRASATKQEADAAMSNILNAIRNRRQRHGEPANWAIDAAKTNSDARQLRNWALGVLTSQRLSEASNACWSVLEIPNMLLTLHPDGGTPIVLVYPSTDISNAFVQLTWGGGFGKYGLLIGTEDFRPHSNWTVKEWLPGIYGWQTSE